MSTWFKYASICGVIVLVLVGYAYHNTGPRYYGKLICPDKDIKVIMIQASGYEDRYWYYDAETGGAIHHIPEDCLIVKGKEISSF